MVVFYIEALFVLGAQILRRAVGRCEVEKRVEGD